MKKVLSIFMAIVMLCTLTTCLDFSASAEDTILVDGDYEYAVFQDGTVKITEYIGTATDITIPSTLGGYA